jgi:WD40 repeat protein
MRGANSRIGAPWGIIGPDGQAQRHCVRKSHDSFMYSLFPIIRAAAALLVAAFLASGTAVAQNAGSEPRLVAPDAHGAHVVTAMFSPDGRFVVTASDDRTARLWETATGREIRRFEGHTGFVRVATFSPDGRLVVTGSADSTARIWDVATGRELRRFTEHTNQVRWAAFSPDGRFLVTASNDSTARIAGTAGAARALVGHRNQVWSAAFSPDGLLVVTASNDSTARIWDAMSGALLRTLDRHTGFVWSARFSPDGRFVVTASTDGTARISDAMTGAPVCTIDGHERGVNSAVFSPDGLLVATASDDRTVRFWNGSTCEPSGDSLAHAGVVRSAAFSPDGQLVATGSFDGTVRLWDVSRRREVRQLVGQTRPALAAAFTPDGAFVVTGSGDGAVRLWATETGRQVRRLDGHTGPVGSVAISGDGRFVLTTTRDHPMRARPSTYRADPARLWELATGREIRRLEAHTDWVSSAAFSADGRYFITTAGDSTARLWQVASGQPVGTPLTAHRAAVRSGSFSPDGRRVVTASDDSTAMVWDTDTGRRRHTLTGHADRVWTAVFSPDGRFIVTASDDGTARLWNAATGQPVGVPWAAHSGVVRAAAFSPDGRRVLTGSHDRTARLWDVATGQVIHRLEHEAQVNSVAFSPGGDFMLTTSDDGAVRVWSASAGVELFRRFAFGETDWVAIAPDGRFDGSEDGMERMHYARGLETIALEAFFTRFYTPGLTRLSAAAVTGRGPDIRQGVLPPPAVRILSPRPGAVAPRVTVAIETTDRGGGVHDIRLYHNGARVLPPDSWEAVSTALVEACPAGATCYAVDLIPDTNTLEATAFSRDSTEAERARVEVTVDGAPAAGKLHVLVVGIDVYSNPRYRLHYARADAAAFADSLRRGGEGLFTDVHVTPLYDGDATRANIEAAFRRIAAAARPEDVFVFYYAGHGTAAQINGSERFFLVPTDITVMGDTAQLLRAGIDGAQLRTLFEAAPALSKLMVLDACKSGVLVEGFDVAEGRAVGQLARDVGMVVMSAADERATEVNALGHGILTYAWLSALKSTPGGVPELRRVQLVIGQAENLVPDLSARYGRPQTTRGWRRGHNFPLVMR